jgi:iron complex transport system ATP-binding protein
VSNFKSIEIKNAAWGYLQQQQCLEVLSNIHLSLQPGDFVGIAGLNGSGKSTLLKGICGLLPLSKGEVFLNGQSLQQIEKNELAKKVAIVLTEKIAGFNLTAYDAVAAGQLPYTNIFNKLEAKHLEVIERAIDTAGIRVHVRKLLSELSDGLFQKTMIAKCIAQQTPIMLLDEPSAFLDFASKHDLFLLLKQLCDHEQKCIVLSSHDLDLILKYCNKILLVKDGAVELMEVDKAKVNATFIELTGGYL